jgi:signal peptidase
VSRVRPGWHDAHRAARLDRLRRGTWLALTLAAVGAWAFALRPTSLGGPATYVVVRGDSMLPGFHSGDLVLLLSQPSYRVGDVVGYGVPRGEVGAGHVVLHRLVGGDGTSGFAVQGDNNPAPDPWLPRAGDVRGRLWLLLPGFGTAISILHQPAVLAALAVSLLVVVALSRWQRPATLRRKLAPGLAAR